MGRWNLERLLEKRRSTLEIWLYEHNIDSISAFNDALIRMDLQPTEDLTKKATELLTPKVATLPPPPADLLPPEPKKSRKHKTEEITATE